MRTIISPALLALAVVAAPASAHFNMLLPDIPSAKKGQPVTFTYQWGHPFEHELFDAPQPQAVMVLAPDGHSTDLTKSLERISLPASEGKHVTAYRFHFTPEQRGDYVLLLETPPIWMEEDGEFLQDIVKVILHVQAQKGWDAKAGAVMEITPLTRPYGLEPGMVFQAALEAKLHLYEQRLSTDSFAVRNDLVEIEHYHPVPPKSKTPDEFCTRSAKSDTNGVVTATLTDPGWWCLAAAREAGAKDHDGKSYPVRERSILWVYVDEKIADK
jgi:cobalt/nickel transport protein